MYEAMIHTYIQRHIHEYTNTIHKYTYTNTNTRYIMHPRKNVYIHITYIYITRTRIYTWEEYTHVYTLEVVTKRDKLKAREKKAKKRTQKKKSYQNAECRAGIYITRSSICSAYLPAHYAMHRATCLIFDEGRITRRVGSRERSQSIVYSRWVPKDAQDRHACPLSANKGNRRREREKERERERWREISWGGGEWRKSLYLPLWSFPSAFHFCLFRSREKET